MVLKDRLRKFVAPLIVGSLVMVSVTGFAMAQSQTPSTQVPSAGSQDAKEQTPDYIASITLGQQDNSVDESKDNGNEAKEDASLSLKAKISKDDAINAAKAAYPEYIVKDAGLSNENGNLIYEVNMSDKAGTAIGVKVDAGNAKVLAADNNTEDEKNSAGNDNTQDKENSIEDEKGATGTDTDTDNVEVEE